VESDLKEMLDRRAEDMHLPPNLPPATLRRARRRRGWSVAFTGVTVVAVIAGTVVAIQASSTTTGHRVGETPTPPQPTEGTPPPLVEGDFAVPAIWPETNPADIQAEQSAVDAGADSWRTDPASVGRRFARDVAGWDDVAVSATWVDASSGHAAVDVINRHTFDTAHTGAMALELAQVGRAGEGGMWSVLGVEPDAVVGQSINLSCGTHPLVPGGAGSTICGTLSPVLAKQTTLRYALFEGDRFEIGAVDRASFADAPDQGRMVLGLHDRFQTELTSPLDANASLPPLEVLGPDGALITMFTDRLRVPRESGSPSGPVATTGPGPTSGPSTTGHAPPPAIRRALWPVVTPARLNDLAQQATAGKADYALQADSEAEEFAVRVLGWPRDRAAVQGTADGIVYHGVPGVQAIVQNADLGPSTALIVHLESVTADGATLWLVVEAQSEAFNVTCPAASASTLETTSPLHVCGVVNRAPAGSTATATVEYVESELQPSEAQSQADLRLAGSTIDGRLRFNADYASSDVAFVVRLAGPDGTLVGMEARRLRVA